MTHLDDLRAQAARERRAKIDAGHARMARWKTKHAGRLATMHPDVQLEVESVVLPRFIAGEQSGLSDDDLHACLMRVASRLRIKRYGACDDPDELGRQLRECFQAIGGEPVKAAA